MERKEAARGKAVAELSKLSMGQCTVYPSQISRKEICDPRLEGVGEKKGLEGSGGGQGL